MINRTLLLAGLVTLGLSVAACNGDDAQENNGAAVDTNVAGAPAGAPAEPAGEMKSYESQGTVTKIDRENNRITLDHEKIGDWMDAMEMPFPVADAALLDQVEEGKRYAFTVEVAANDDTNYKITKVTPAP